AAAEQRGQPDGRVAEKRAGSRWRDAQARPPVGRTPTHRAAGSKTLGAQPQGRLAACATGCAAAKASVGPVELPFSLLEQLVGALALRWGWNRRDPDRVEQGFALPARENLRWPECAL